MSTVVTVPQINVNDDFVRIVSISVELNQKVEEGQEIIVVETSKATESIYADQEGYIRRILTKEGEEKKIGEILFIITPTLEEEIKEETLVQLFSTEKGSGSASREKQFTLKARMLAQEHGINIGDVPTSTGRVDKKEVLQYLNRPSVHKECTPLVPGKKKSLSRFDKAIISNIGWAKNEAISAYAEASIDIQLLIDYANKLQKKNSYLFDPLFPLLCWQFVNIVKSQPYLNAVCIGDDVVIYKPINLGFTVDVKGSLYLAVLHNTHEQSFDSFIEGIFTLQRKAVAKELSQKDIEGATIGITSLAAYGIHQHQPILASQTSLMLAHSAVLPYSSPGTAYTNVGVTYDHRIHSGIKIAKLLKSIAQSASNPHVDKT